MSAVLAAMMGQAPAVAQNFGDGTAQLPVAASAAEAVELLGAPPVSGLPPAEHPERVAAERAVDEPAEIPLPLDPLVMRRAEDQVRNAYRFVFSLPEGQIVLADLCAHAGMSADIPDAQALRFLGARRVILRMLSLAKVSEGDVMRRMLLSAAAKSDASKGEG